MTRRRGRGEDGIALIVVLWGLALLGALAAGIATHGRGETRLVSDLRDAAESRHMADAGIALALRDLLDPRTADDVDRTGAPRDYRIDGTPITVQVSDEAGRIDLNEAPGELLRGLFMTVAPDRAANLAAAVQDWRDGDDDRRTGGAEAIDYRRLGRDGEPANAPFQRVEELARVRGMDAALFARVAPLVTVHSRLDGLDPDVASAATLAAIPGLSETVAGRLSRDRRQDSADLVAFSRFFRHSPGRAFTIAASVTGPGGRVFRRSALVWLTFQPDAPYRLLARHDG
ncbi:general secretion pathway protein GspK [Oceanibacterium hippocampi]|uniref:General secretion pathway protein K n=1 Tax=Oceanibacterium hippocampi TaxID=745714 RepID=A0A1Y5T6T1_9PROT|nr:type II secretion system protein GspK [Oceanibacterium hippocampi]SLN56869.1 General secretion pathway protein K [Oceanibacterium hippocampi]